MALIGELKNKLLRRLRLAAAIAWQRMAKPPINSVPRPPEFIPHNGNFDSVYQVVECRGIMIAVDPEVISTTILNSLKAQAYEMDEERELEHLLQEGEIVLEIGGGCGLVSTYCALNKQVRAVFCVEANPMLIPLLRETHRLNKVEVSIYNEVLGAADGISEFYLREDFWNSSKMPAPEAKQIRVKMTSFQSRLDEVRPTLLIVDIEGGEIDLFDSVQLPSSVKKIFLEFHQNVIGRAGMKKVFDALSSRNFHYDGWHSHNHVVTFSHVDRV